MSDKVFVKLEVSFDNESCERDCNKVIKSLVDNRGLDEGCIRVDFNIADDEDKRIDFVNTKTDEYLYHLSIDEYITANYQ